MKPDRVRSSPVFCLVATLLATLIALPERATPADQPVQLARNARPQAVIVVSATASPAEQTAAREIADYLRKITSSTFVIVPETSVTAASSTTRETRIFVGPTQFADQNGVRPAALGAEEWIVRTVGKDLVIAGGRPRGTLYAAYHFLEDTLGVHWWSPFEETVPASKTLRIPVLNQHGKPGIQYRDIYMLFGHDNGRFAARNRLNREGDARIDAPYGGSRDYGPPYHVHTFHGYFPPGEFFATHPEWYSLIDGKRVADNAQLCLTQPGLRKAFLEKLIANIESSRARARDEETPPPLVFSVSQNDCLNPCQCDNCQAIAKAEGSECGPLLDFVNFLADGIKDRFPGVFLDTLAYQYTQKAPATISPRDNVIVRLCDTDSDPTQPITAPANTAFREHLTRWSEIARNLRVWDYAVTYANPVGMPIPTVQTYGPDYRFYAAHHVEGVFTELEFEILADMRDLKVWMMMKQLEDPGADYASLLRTFTEGFYGPAAGPIRAYLADLETEARARHTRADWNSTFQKLPYLNLPFITRAQRLFERAERAVAGNPILLRRVRHARLPLDRASVMLHPQLVSAWNGLGRPSPLTPPPRAATAHRVIDTWVEQSKLRLPAPQQPLEQQRAEGEMRRYAIAPDDIVPPSQFRSAPKGSVRDYLATMTRNWGDVVKVVRDPEAESGIANKLDLTTEGLDGAEKYVLPMSWGVYDQENRKHIGSAAIREGEIPGPGYHWYKLGTFPVGPGYYVYFFWSWIIQADVDDAFDPAHPSQPYEIWARVKFTGPRFPHARPGETNAIFVERLVLLRSRPVGGERVQMFRFRPANLKSRAARVDPACACPKSGDDTTASGASFATVVPVCARTRETRPPKGV